MFMARQAIRRCYRVYNSLGEESLCVSPAPLGILCVHYTVAVPGFWGVYPEEDLLWCLGA